MKFMVTGGAGFIGSAVVRHLIQHINHDVLTFDALTYAGNLNSLSSISDCPRHTFVEGNICAGEQIRQVIADFRPNIIMHLAAETHVDRSIDNPQKFIETNILGTCTLLEEARSYWQDLPPPQQDEFRFHQISTDEVFGSLEDDHSFTETSPYAPNSPYSASKASADHLVRAWHQTYGLPTVTSNCSNNYGPYQFPEKLIPLIILNALAGKPLPIYGSGQQIRDWLYVEDHAVGLVKVATQGQLGQVYNIGASEQHSNIDVVTRLCAALDELQPSISGPYARLITHVTDRPGHDVRYGVNSSKITRELGWKPEETFESGLKKTVTWYLENRDWR